MAAREGPLVLADISGYTAFMAEAELEHSRAILSELLELLVRAIARHLRIGEIEGDAIFGVGERMPPHAVEWMQECFVRYQRRLRDIQEVTTCPCRACASVGALTLKFVAHYGEYLPQRFGGKEQFVGREVNVVHRLLKNSVPSREYVLATAAFLDHLPMSARAGFLPHTERSDGGEVSCAYVDLAGLREQARSATERRVVESDHARLTLRRTYATSRERLWQALTEPLERQRWMASRPSRVDYRPGARGTLLGGEYHCEHGRRTAAVHRIVSAAPPDQLTTVTRALALLWQTARLRTREEGSVELVLSFHWERGPGITGRITDALLRAILLVLKLREMKAIGRLVAGPTESPAPP